MTRGGFRKLFLRALKAAASAAHVTIIKPLPDDLFVELHAPGAPGHPIRFDEAVDALYLGGDRCYRVIDVAIRRVLPDRIEAFVRVSGHPPAGLSQSWDPPGLGPFKPMLAETVEGRDARAG